MEIKINYTKNIYKNIDELYEKIKKIRKKRENAIKTKKSFEGKKKKDRKESVVEKKESGWYEKFYWGFTSKNKLIISGKNKEQNDIIYKNYFESKDLFFHADIIGGGATILKKGVEAEQEELVEAAQFSACYSKAWKEGYMRINTYMLGKDGVTKSLNGKSADPGSFFIIGERKWFKNILLSLRIGEEEGSIRVVPGFSKKHFNKEVEIKPGRVKKEAAASEIAKFLKINKEEVLHLLPNGRIYIKKVK